MNAQIRCLRSWLNRMAPWVLLVGLHVIGIRQWLRRAAPYGIQSEPTPLVPNESDYPAISVLVAAWNEATTIQRFIDSFQRLSYPRCELVLCAGGTDATLAQAMRSCHPHIRVIPQYIGEGKQHALRRCFAEAHGEIMVLTDADCELNDHALCTLLTPLIAGEAQIATGVSLPHPDQWHHALVEYQGLLDLAWQSQLPAITDGVLGRNCAITRGLADQLAIFEAPAATGTDYVLSRMVTQAGIPIHAIATSRITTEYPETPQAYLRMWRRWNKNLLIYGWKYRAWNDVRGVVQAATIYATIWSLPLLAPLMGWMALVIAGLLIIQATANRLQRLALGARLRGAPISWRLRLMVPWYLVLDMLAVFLAIGDSLSPQRRRRW